MNKLQIISESQILQHTQLLEENYQLLEVQEKYKSMILLNNNRMSYTQVNFDGKNLDQLLSTALWHMDAIKIWLLWNGYRPSSP